MQKDVFSREDIVYSGTEILWNITLLAFDFDTEQQVAKTLSCKYL